MLHHGTFALRVRCLAWIVLLQRHDPALMAWPLTDVIGMKSSWVFAMVEYHHCTNDCEAALNLVIDLMTNPSCHFLVPHPCKVDGSPHRVIVPTFHDDG